MVPWKEQMILVLLNRRGPPPEYTDHDIKNIAYQARKCSGNFGGGLSQSWLQSYKTNINIVAC